MGREIQTAERFRNCANALRIKAEDEAHSAARDVLLKLAADYDCMAARLRAIDLLNQTEAVQQTIREWGTLH